MIGWPLTISELYGAFSLAAVELDSRTDVGTVLADSTLIGGGFPENIIYILLN